MGGAGKPATDHRQVTQGGLQMGLHMFREQRREHEQTPDAIDDGRHARQQFDGGTQGPTQPNRTGFGKKQGDAEAHRHGDDQGDDRGHHRAVDGGQGAVLVFRHVPHVGPQEAGPECLQHRHGLDGQGNQDAGQGGQYDEGEHQGDLMEQQILQLEFLDLRGVHVYGCRHFAHSDLS
jgi:hypothetical protein